VANVNDPMIQKVAQFAVRIYTLIMGELKMQLQNVVSGETQPSNGGYNYRLVITVSGGKTTHYEAFVWRIHASWQPENLHACIYHQDHNTSRKG
jgi:hypothetical protein